jgi:hypothetical protein
MALDPKAILAEIDSLITECGPRVRNFSATPEVVFRPETHEVANLLISGVQRLAPPNSSYRSELKATLESHGTGNPEMVGIKCLGMLTALRKDIEAGRLRSFEELLHADLFADFLEMAQHLLDEGNYKDPAAVICGSVLEEHLRKLAAKHSIPTVKPDGIHAVLAATLNAELAKVQAYSKIDEKNVTAWLALRNEAAHGHYAKYTLQEVVDMLQNVRHFLARAPA